MSNKILLFVVTEGWYFYSHRLPMVRAAQQAGYEVCVICQAGDIADKIQGWGVKVYNMDFDRKSLNPFSALLVIISLRKLYKKIRPDIIHHIAMKPIVFGSIAASFLNNIKIINAFAGLGFVFCDNSFKAKAIRLLLVPVFKIILKNNNRYLLFQNYDDKELFDSLGLCNNDNVKVVYGSGVDLDKYKAGGVSYNDGDKLICIFAGRMIKIKGIDVLVKAFDVLKTEDINAELWLCGEPDSHNPSSYSVNDLQAFDEKKNIKWLGKQNDMADIWNKGHVAVQVSFGGEGVPKSLIEAASCEKVIIASNSAGCREMVTNDNGFLIEINDVDSIVVAVKSLARDPEKVKLMSVNSKQLVIDKFSSDIVTSEICEFYIQVSV